MDTSNLKDIKKKLNGKQIFLIPYCHADYAWLHSRDWHLRKYLAVFDKMVDLFKTRPDFKYFIDSWSELLAPCLEKRSESLPFLNQMLEDGRLAIVGGQWSNIRFSHVGDETSIRNMLFGHQRVAKLFPKAELDSYANLDVGIGHSQVSQLLRLAGYQNYFAWRPQHGLDSQGVPRSFTWRGLDGCEVLVTRHAYQGWFHAPEFVDFKGGEEIFKSREIDFDHVVRHTWEKYLEIPAKQSKLNTLSFCQGSDDSLPLTDAFYGFERDVNEIIRQWNESKALGAISYGTPRDVFKALKAQKDDLPVWNGLLDPAEMCFHIARNGKNSIWWLRESADRALVLAEQIAALAAATGDFVYPEEELDDLWRQHLTFCTHAVEFVFHDDFDNARFALEEVSRKVRSIQTSALESMISDSETNDPLGFIVFNPIVEERRAIVEIDVPNIDNSRRTPIFKDQKGAFLPSQINYVGGLARDFLVLVESDLPPGGLTPLNLEWNDKDLVPKVPELSNNMNAEISSDRIKMIFEKGVLSKIENLMTGNIINASGDAGILEPLALPQKVGYWMPESFDDNPLQFIPKTLSVVENGPLRFRVTRTGTSGPHCFTQKIDLLKGSDTVDVETIADIAPDSANIAIGMPLGEKTTLHVDIPFGVEKRDPGSIEYGHKGEGNYENIERRIPGIFWGRSWCFAADETQSFGLVSLDGPRYFRRYGNPERLLHFLVCVNPDNQNGWMTKTYSQRALGRHEFKHKLVISGNDWSKVEMPRIAQESRLATIVVPGVRPRQHRTLSISPTAVRLSAFHKEGDDFILRVYNAASTNSDCEVHLPFKIRTVKCCDFNGIGKNKLITSKNDNLSFELDPWEIATMRIIPG